MHVRKWTELKAYKNNLISSYLIDPKAIPGSTYGGDGPKLLGGLLCSGDEDSLIDCPRRDYSCRSYSDVATVVCSNGKFVLLHSTFFAFACYMERVLSTTSIMSASGSDPTQRKSQLYSWSYKAIASTCLAHDIERGVSLGVLAVSDARRHLLISSVEEAYFPIFGSLQRKMMPSSSSIHCQLSLMGFYKSPSG